MNAQSLQTQSAKVSPVSAPSKNAHRKRKRGPEKAPATDIDPSKLGDLWEKVIEGKQEDSRSSKRKKNQAEDATPGQDVKVPSTGEQAVPSRKDKKKRRRGAANQDVDSVEGSTRSADHQRPKAAADGQIAQGQAKKAKEVKSPSEQRPKPGMSQLKSLSTDNQMKLTPLQASMRQKLVSSRFRHLNELLYTNPSTSAVSIFNDDPSMFTEYHNGFRAQVAVWPENPIDGYISAIRTRGRVYHRSSAPDEAQPLPRTASWCHVADLGCGEAKLAQTLAKKEGKKMKVVVRSFDLQSPNEFVEKADIRDLPVPDGKMDVVVFCLALMGTNWIDFIEEAWRILRWKGELWVAETRSRFVRPTNVGKGSRQAVEHSVGNRKKDAINKKEGRKEKEIREADEDKFATMEVDGVEKPRADDLDVKGFVEVLRRRGFVLNGEVDARNKMFVKMHFFKACTPVAGKCVPKPAVADTVEQADGRKGRPRFIEQAEKQDDLDEAGVLKPCVYKQR